MKILILASFTMAGAGPAIPADRDYCDDVRELAAGAAEAKPFRSLRARNFEPRLLRNYCFFSDAGGYTCGQNLSPSAERRDVFAEKIRACLPGSTLSRGGYFDEEAIVRRGSFEARVMEYGSEGAHVGRTIIIYIKAIAAGDGED